MNAFLLSSRENKNEPQGNSALCGQCITEAFHPISTDVRPVQAIEGFSASDLNESILKSRNIQNAINDLSTATATASSYTSTASIYMKDPEKKYDESNIKKSVNYVPNKTDQIALEHTQYMDKYNMLMGASVVSGMSIAVLVAMLLAKSAASSATL